MSERLRAFAPLANQESRILILGTFPGRLSLGEERYYANPRNHFWSLLALIYGDPVPDSQADRMKYLLNHGIALWDTIAECERKGSLDKDIRDPRPADIPGLLAAHPSIRRVVLNGSAAARYFLRFFGPDFAADRGIDLRTPPSTSPVPSKNYRRLEDKIDSWRNALLGSAASTESGLNNASRG